MKPHVVIGGYGRSGSNMLLDIFDLHARTHCRNEPNDEGASLGAVADFFAPEERAGFLEAWQAALAIAVQSVGASDRLPPRNKSFVKTNSAACLANWLQSKGRVRRMLGLGTEWPCSSLIYDLPELSRAMPVLKIGVCGSLVAAHDDPEQKLVHILRNPADFLNSWYNRYVTKPGRGPRTTFRDMAPYLSRILPLYDVDPGQYSDYSEGALLKGELWLWRYINDQLRTLSHSTRYFLVDYDSAKAHTTETTERLYSFAGLDFNEEHAQQAAGMQNTLFAASHRHQLPKDQVAQAVDDVLRDTSLPI